MNPQWIIVPVLLPLLMAPLLLLCARWWPRWQLPMAMLSTLAVGAVSLGLVLMADAGTIGVYLLGNWQAPFGIVLVLDRLSAMMLLLTAVVAVAAQVAAVSLARHGPHFHTFFQVQLAGLNGAFLTGDLFNLFVFFEVLLIASYALLLHDAKGRALRAGLHYVVINLVASSLFLIAATLLYGVVGTLNIADMAVKLPQLPAGDVGLAQAAALLLLVVFGIKAALLPLGFWLPGTYGAALGPVAAMFAIMTKVGLYGIVRTSMLLFGGGATALTGWGGDAMFALGIVTMVFGALSALSAQRLGTLTGSLVLVSSGTLIGASTMGEDALAGALYYMVHSTLAIALMFLVAYAIGLQRGAVGERCTEGPAVAQPVVLGLLFMYAAVSVAGLPPLSRIHRQGIAAVGHDRCSLHGLVLERGDRQQRARHHGTGARGQPHILERRGTGDRCDLDAACVSRRRRGAGGGLGVLDGVGGAGLSIRSGYRAAACAAPPIHRCGDADGARAVARKGPLMRRLLPHPLLSLVLLGVWLALNNTVALAHLVLGAVLAVGIPWAVTHLCDGRWPTLRRPDVMLRLGLAVLYDIVASNVEVARRVLGPSAAIRPGFIEVPLELTDDWAITLLAGIITMTPGTLTADVAVDRSHLLVHALHIDDADVLVASIKSRYETPLKEIFG